MSSNSIVVLKGNKVGLSIYLNEEFDYIDLKDQLIKKLESARLFFEGAKVISINGKNLTAEEKDEITSIIHSQFNMIIEEKIEDNIVDEVNVATIQDGIDEGMTRYIRTTIRSGQCLKYEGNLVIIGDVNPGGEIIAEGNIVVMGALRGLAHAGSKGNEKAFVVAFCLQPTQLRIANVIARSPDNEENIRLIPELAMIKDCIIAIEPYLPKK
ncbi:MAG: septum site-determining protein MinC [Alkaliphilus sp.]|nr:septum site-determining protein MinC [Alkaliphilus sp.]